jgi:hypothetical protein
MLTSEKGPQIVQHSDNPRPTSLKKSKLARLQLSLHRTMDSGDRAETSSSLPSSAEKAVPERCMPFRMSYRLSRTRIFPCVQL